MKIHPSTVVVPLAVVLLVVGAGAVLATTGGPLAGNPGVAPAAATATPGATTVPAPTTGPATGPATKPDLEDTALADALDKLVADGTITADQKTAILGAVQAERQARIADRRAQRDAFKAQRDLIRGFLSDGVITQQELDQLPADSPLRSLTSLMDDGKITTDELRQLGRDLFLGGRGRGPGIFGPHKGFDQPNASASPSPATGG